VARATQSGLEHNAVPCFSSHDRVLYAALVDAIVLATRPIMIFKSLIVVVAAALAASAQSTTSSSAIALPTGISACILSCSDVASAASGCGS